MVPMNAGRSTRPTACRGTGSTDLTAAADRRSAGFRCTRVPGPEQADVGGHRFAEGQPDDITGDQVGDVELDVLSVLARHRAVCWTRECGATGRAFARYLC